MSTVFAHTPLPSLHLMPHNRREVFRRRRIAAVLVLSALLMLSLFAWHGITLLMQATAPAPLCDEGLVYLDQENMCVTQEMWWDYHQH